MTDFRKTTMAALAGFGALAMLSGQAAAQQQNASVNPPLQTARAATGGEASEQGPGGKSCNGHGPRGGAGFGPPPGPGGGPGGPGFGFAPLQEGQTLSVADVRSRIEKQLLWRGNERLKVGEVKEAEANTITVQIVTVDDSLVETLRVDPGTGWTQPIR